MREIKFRGKRVDGKGWVHGDYCSQDAEYVALIGVWNKLTRSCDWIPVNEESVGQYTGLNGKSGKEVYESHIVNVTNKGIYGGIKVVVWDDTLLCYVLVWVDQFKDWKGTQHGTTFLKVSSGIKCEIIGSVLDNPELLTP